MSDIDQIILELKCLGEVAEVEGMTVEGNDLHPIINAAWETIAALKEQNAQLQQSLADALLQVQEALTRMDRARNLLTDGNPRLHCNWGMLDTSDIKAALPAAYVGVVDNF